MIALASDCLVFRLASGDNIPFSAEMISVELLGETAEFFDPEFVSHSASAVFHYFKHDLGRQIVTVGEFTEALEKVLRGFTLPVQPVAESETVSGVVEADLQQLARESGVGCELFFFPRLRDELRQRLQLEPRLVRFRGLRDCVKHLTGARRWSGRCQHLQDQIVDYLRECLSAEPGRAGLALLVQ
jgi:hypothetical protein